MSSTHRRCAVRCSNRVFRAGYCLQHHNSVYRMWSERGPWCLQTARTLSRACGRRQYHQVLPAWDLLAQGKLEEYRCPRCFIAVLCKSLDAFERSQGLPVHERQEMFLAVLAYMWHNRAVWAVDNRFYALRGRILQKIGYARSAVSPLSLVRKAFPVCCCRWCLNPPVSSGLCHVHLAVVESLSPRLPLDVLEFCLCRFVGVRQLSTNYVHAV